MRRAGTGGGAGAGPGGWNQQPQDGQIQWAVALQVVAEAAQTGQRAAMGWTGGTPSRTGADLVAGTWRLEGVGFKRRASSPSQDRSFLIFNSLSQPL
jgi:hypothetical protein